MALIEGVGDEVTALFALLLAAAVLGLAWASTRAPEPAAAPPEQAPSADPAPAEHTAPEAAAAAGGEVPEGADGQAAGLRSRAGPAPAATPAQGPVGDGDGGPAEPTMVLRLKFLNDTERLARVRPGDTVGALKRACFPGQEQQVRLIYQGQLLRDDSQRLAALALAPHSVLHCHVCPPGPAPAPAAPRGPAGPAHAALNVGGLLLPLLVLLLAALWYFQLRYRHVFTATATAFLAGLTLLFSFVAFAVYRR